MLLTVIGRANTDGSGAAFVRVEGPPGSKSGARGHAGDLALTDDEWTSLKLAAQTLETHCRELARVQFERDEARQQLQWERDHSKMLSDTNARLCLDNQEMERFLAKVRGDYTEACRERDQARSELSKAERELDYIASTLCAGARNEGVPARTIVGRVIEDRTNERDLARAERDLERAKYNALLSGLTESLRWARDKEATSDGVGREMAGFAASVLAQLVAAAPEGKAT
jgi:hypothetical protein